VVDQNVYSSVPATGSAGPARRNGFGLGVDSAIVDAGIAEVHFRLGGPGQGLWMSDSESGSSMYFWSARRSGR